MRIDFDQSSTISPKEMDGLAALSSQDADRFEKLMAAVDIDENGSISLQEIIGLIRYSGGNLTDEENQTYFRYIDED